jgi:signal transduction histidine kinase
MSELGIVGISSLLARQLERRERERAALARTLHDELCGQLVAARMLVARLLEPSTLPSDVALIGLKEVERQLAAAITINRRIVERLRPGLLDHFGLSPALQALVEGQGRDAGLEVAVRLPQEPLELSPEAGICLYRVAEEALDNVVKHAQASRVELQVVRQATRCVMTLRDNGVGFDPSRLADLASVGLPLMRERLGALGGRLALTAAPGSGVCLVASLPLAAALRASADS